MRRKTFLISDLIVIDMAFPISKLTIAPIYKLWLRKAEGLDNLPKGAFIIAGNHTSYYDTLLIPCIIIPKIKRKMHAWVNSSYWKNPFTGFFLTIWECIPIYVKNEKNTRRKNNEAFEKALCYLKKNEPIMIFPEGHRSKDGKLQKAYTGISRLALKAKVPVVPAGIIGSNKVLPKGKTFPRFARCDVKIGNPIYFEKYCNKKPTKKDFEEATRIIMKEIAKLINQEYNY